MIGQVWLTLKQAQEALRAGRLEETQQFLAQPPLPGHRRCLELLQQLLRAFVERGQRHLRNNDVARAWSDLLHAEGIGIGNPGTIALRQSLTRLGLAEVSGQLNAGQPKRALDAIHMLHERAVQVAELSALEQGARDWLAANEFADKGEFVRALQAIDRAGGLLRAHGKVLSAARQGIEQRQRTFAPLVAELHDAAMAERWPQVLQLSDRLLAVAPHHAEIGRLRSRAWKALEPPTVMVPQAQASAPPAVHPPAPRKRFILWIDGVGGYLLLLENSVTLGQAGPEAVADVALLADVSRNHARLTRDSEGYVVEAVRPVAVNNQGVDKKLLRHGDRLTLGASCQLTFRQDVPVSATARLDLISGHRFGHGVDGVILMAETLVLGPGDAHIQIPELRQPVILYRNKEEIGIRSAEEITVNGRAIRGRAFLEPGHAVAGGEFSLSLEAVEPGATVPGMSQRGSSCAR